MKKTLDERIEEIPLTSYEKKCASKLAHAFYDYAPEWQSALPPFKEVVKVARELIHREYLVAEIRDPQCISKNSFGVPLMPSTGFDYVGVEYFLDHNCEEFNNLRKALVACMESTYKPYYGD